MRWIGMLAAGAAFFLLFGAQADAQYGDCHAFLNASQSGHGANTIIKIRNVAHQPLVAYVIRSTPAVKSDAKSYSLHGVFTDGDVLRPGQMMNAGTTPRGRVKGLLQVDYVRMVDGTSCGRLATEDAKLVAARFE